MPQVFYLPDRIGVEVEEGDFLLDASKAADIPHTHVCGGAGRCSTCRVAIVDGADNCGKPNATERSIAHQLHFAPSIRLACQTQILGDVTVRRLAIDGEDLELINAQIKGKVQPETIGQEKNVAILFADLRGFTSLSEELLPYDVIYLLNRYFRRMGEAIERHGGIINNYMGDGLMALFGVGSNDRAAEGAVRAGLDMMAAMERLNPYIETLYGQNLKIGVGIHYGDVVIGEVGAIDNAKLTAIGDAVNLASRIESANKALGTTLLISETTYEQVKELVSVKAVFQVKLKGKSGEYPLYEVDGIDPPREVEPVARISDKSDRKPSLWRKIRQLFIRVWKAFRRLLESGKS
ncbi:MAG: adenylate/guanylate cyclase domain-containing protein [Cyanobacteriota bacterium]|nr:adenylate/guanylate cyclase domain-containing protein [Cyanobacteriota bacterium]